MSELAKKCYVIMICGGEYSGRWSKPARVFLDLAKAQETMVKLETIEKKYNDLVYRTRPGDDWRIKGFRAQEAKPLIIAEYAAVGVEADLDNDWCLEEAELEQ